MNILQKRWEEFGPGKVKGLKFKSLQDDGFPTQFKTSHHCKTCNKQRDTDSLQNKAKEAIICEIVNLKFDYEEACLNSALIRFIAQVKCLFRQNRSALFLAGHYITLLIF